MPPGSKLVSATENEMSKSHEATTAAAPRFADDLECPECGYSLRGLTSARCPECGLDLGFVESADSLIPWQRARGLRRIVAFWQTVLLVTFRPKRFCRAACQHVDYPAAVAFRFAAVIHAFVAFAAAVWVIDHCSKGTILTEIVEDSARWYVGVVAVAGFVGLIVFSGMPTYLFHPRYLSVRRQNRAVALSHYGCAPLAFVFPLGGALCVVIRALARWGHLNKTSLFDTGMLGLAILVVVGLAGCWWSWSWLGAHLLKRGPRRLVLTWIWSGVSVLAAVLCAALLCGVMYYLAVVFYSLHG